MNEKKEKTMRKVLQEGTVYPRVNCIKLPENLSEKAAEVLYTHVKKYLILMGKLQSVKLTMR